MRLTICFLLSSLAPAWVEFPKILPDSLKGHAAVVIVGFSKGSQEAVKAWYKAQGLK